ncbi:hypothetical protein SmJEL517_g02791 [Synchytrium microbalum]|uniref:SAC domain-containing protein n=1 Tax=Synchytrium microbalum TaxID=1806994 RepID=A0A507C5A3_9FUNG|nr:uncharacterized protein SmJEL517_g02791 [Synchytrium microbalum]TPX34558.1 hypothetical protein SmJEL517_g02791 [Synchytrium microbalum]
MASGSSHTRDAFRIFRTSEGRLLIERPLRVTKNQAEATQFLVFDTDGSASVRARRDVYPTDTGAIASISEAFGIVGVLNLAFASYLLVISARSLAATLQSHKVYRIIAGNILVIGKGPINTLDKYQPPQSAPEDLAKFLADQEVLQDISQLLNCGHLYYSSSYDITHSLQHNYLSTNKKAVNTIIDDRYWFNKHLQSPLLASSSTSDYSPWVLKVMCGFAGTVDIKVPSTATAPVSGKQNSRLFQSYTITLLSRLSTRRVGTRYVRRGLDLDGNAANSVESEQITFPADFINDKMIASYVQTRGSKPGLWSQELDLSYRPEIRMVHIEKPPAAESIQRHFEDLKKQYVGEQTIGGGVNSGKVLMLNLLDDRGFEARLTKAYEEAVGMYGDEKKFVYEGFPVNRYCRGMNYKNMDLLVDRVKSDVAGMGAFVAEGDVPSLASGGSLRIIKLQTGITRVSCLDSLDRTNLTLTILARHILASQLYSILESPSTASSKDPPLYIREAITISIRDITNMWADSGDAASLVYAGTRALRADVTRTGKRQKIKGSLDDGLNAVTRYYLNNFVDGRRQDALDLWTGRANSEDVAEYATTHVSQQVQRLAHPFFIKSGPGAWMPNILSDFLEPLLQASQEYSQTLNQRGNALSLSAWRKPHFAPDDELSRKPLSYPAFMVTVLKLYAPARIQSAFDFMIAIVVFLLVATISRVFAIPGILIADKSRFSREYKKIRELGATPSTVSVASSSKK